MFVLVGGCLLHAPLGMDYIKHVEYTKYLIKKRTLLRTRAILYMYMILNHYKKCLYIDKLNRWTRCNKTCLRMSYASNAHFVCLRFCYNCIVQDWTFRRFIHLGTGKVQSFIKKDICHLWKGANVITYLSLSRRCLIHNTTQRANNRTKKHLHI